MSPDSSDGDDIPEISLDELLSELRTVGATSPTDDEAAAIAAAISAHLGDRQRAAAAAEADEAADTVPNWTFAGRLDAVGARTRRRPRRVERGGEWKAAARSL